MKSNQRPIWREILGDPNGVEHGYPTDFRYSSDTETLWIKSRGFGTPFGWVPIAGGGVEGTMQELILDASVVALNPTVPTEGQENVTVPTGFTAAERARNGNLSGLVVMLYEPDPVNELACMFQTVLPLVYGGGDLQIVVELAGDGETIPADAEMYALITAEPEGTDPLAAPTFGAEIPLTTTITTDGIIQTAATISGAQLDGLVAGDAFRVLLGRHAADPYTGAVTFIRGRIRELTT